MKMFRISASRLGCGMDTFEINKKKKKLGSNISDADRWAQSCNVCAFVIRNVATKSIINHAEQSNGSAQNDNPNSNKFHTRYTFFLRQFHTQFVRMRHIHHPLRPIEC